MLTYPKPISVIPREFYSRLREIVRRKPIELRIMADYEEAAKRYFYTVRLNGVDGDEFNDFGAYLDDIDWERLDTTGYEFFTEGNGGNNFSIILSRRQSCEGRN